MEEKGLLEFLERRQYKKELREKRDAFIKRLRGEIEISPLIKRIRRRKANDVDNRRSGSQWNRFGSR